MHICPLSTGVLYKVGKIPALVWSRAAFVRVPCRPQFLTVMHATGLIPECFQSLNICRIELKSVLGPNTFQKSSIP